MEIGGGAGGVAGMIDQEICVAMCAVSQIFIVQILFHEDAEGMLNAIKFPILEKRRWCWFENLRKWVILVKFAITMKNLITLSYRDQCYRSKPFIHLLQVLKLFQTFCSWFLNILSLVVYSQRVYFIASFLQTPNLRLNDLMMSGSDEPSRHNV